MPADQSILEMLNRQIRLPGVGDSRALALQLIAPKRFASPAQVDAGGAVIQVKLQAVRTSNTW